MLSLQQGGASLYVHGHYSVGVIDVCRNSGLNLEQHDFCALQWNVFIVDTPGTATCTYKNVPISEALSI